jgi:hypothetical protein
MTEQTDIEKMSHFDFAMHCMQVHSRAMANEVPTSASTPVLKEAARRLAIIDADDEPEKADKGRDEDIEKAEYFRQREQAERRKAQEVRDEYAKQVELLRVEIRLLRELLKWKDTALIAVATGDQSLANHAANRVNTALDKLTDLGKPVP